MQSGIDDKETVKDVEIKRPELSKSIVKVTQAETEIHSSSSDHHADSEKTLPPPCIKSRCSYDNFIQTNDKTKKNPHYLTKKSQNSDSNLIKPTGLSKILTWDPWLKIGRNKNKKDKRKNEETKEKLTVVADQKTGDGPQSQSTTQQEKKEVPQVQPEVTEVVDSEPVEDFNPRPAKVRKIVRFHSDVKVVHYFDDEILGHSIEPLKKELEQQERNKELRKEFTPETGLGLKQSLKKSASDYMAAWYKR